MSQWLSYTGQWEVTVEVSMQGVGALLTVVSLYGKAFCCSRLMDAVKQQFASQFHHVYNPVRRCSNLGATALIYLGGGTAFPDSFRFINSNLRSLTSLFKHYTTQVE